MKDRDEINPLTGRPLDYVPKEYRCSCGQEVDSQNWNWWFEKCRDCVNEIQWIA